MPSQLQRHLQQMDNSLFPEEPKQNIAQLALTLVLVRLAGDGQSSLQDSTTADKHTVGSSQLN